MEHNHIDVPVSNNNLHVEWLCCLYKLSKRIRREGLMAIEEDVVDPWNKDSLFRQFPSVMTEPGLSFATDLLLFMVNGIITDEDVIRVSAEEAIKGHIADQGNVSESLLRTIWLIIWGTLKGFNPRMACHLGRHAIPISLKPSAAEMENLITTLEGSPRNKSKDEINVAIDNFMDSINKGPEDLEQNAKCEMLKILAQAKLVVEQEQQSVCFIIEDIPMRNWIQGKLKASGLLFDTSFDTEIIKVEKSYFGKVLGEIYTEHKMRHLIEKLSSAESAALFANAKKEFIISFVSELGSKSPTHLLLKSLLALVI